jgi:hypothetical protein
MSTPVTLSAFNGKTVVRHYVGQGQNFVYPTTQSVYENKMTCSRGTANVDNVCVCENAADTMPYLSSPPMFDVVYGATIPSLIREPNPAARYLMAQRRPTFMNKQLGVSDA